MTRAHHMNRLFYLICALISYGSLFPFEIEAAPAGAWAELLATWHKTSSRGDLLGNIILFVPMGMVGVWCYGRKPWQLATVFILAFVLAFALQILQIYIPSRDPSLQDVLWNTVGTGIGMGLALVVPKQTLARENLNLKNNALFLLLLMGAWLCYRLMPFIPTIDFQSIKDSLKPLLLHPQLNGLGLFHDSLAWAAFACMLAAFIKAQNPLPLPRRQHLAILTGIALATFCGEILILQNTLSLTNLTGAVLGIALWWFWPQRLGGITTPLALMLALMLILKGLSPFQLSPQAAEFHWLPFHGFIEGSMIMNSTVLFEKFFLYGALLWLLQQEGAGPRFALMTTLILTTGIEIGQLFFVGHTPEITEPFLVLLIAYSQRGLSPQASLPPQTQARPAT